jgi:hypothetical protein
MARRDMGSRTKTNSEMQDRTTTDVIGKAAGRDQHQRLTTLPAYKLENEP